MKHKIRQQKWAELFRNCKTHEEREKLLGIPIKLAASFLKISRSRVHQLIREEKLNTIEVYDEVNARIANMVTLKSLERRRRTVKPRRTQW